jgi:hypothetical protein
MSLRSVPSLELADFMKHNKSPLGQNEKQMLAGGCRPTAVQELSQSKIDFAPPSDEVASRAYFNYVNQGSQPGHDVQHWLDAETELIAERYLGRMHEFRNQT